jgi:CRISPR-associated protein Cas5t
MNVTRVTISGWTASFRYPIFIVGLQPTLPVPPLSTIFGLISAACGKPVEPKDTRVGYVFQSSGKTEDLETIYEINDKLRGKSNIVKREILFQPQLYLYIENKEIGQCFSSPHYPLLLGRSSDLCMVEKVEEITLMPVVGAPVLFGGTMVPLAETGLQGIIQALPTHFSQDIPRRAQGTKLFSILERIKKTTYQGLLVDSQRDWGVYMHE